MIHHIVKTLHFLVFVLNNRNIIIFIFSPTSKKKLLCWRSIFESMWSELFTRNSNKYFTSWGKSKWYNVCIGLWSVIDLIGFLIVFRINPRFPCPCTLGQAQADARFVRLFSETNYETSQNIICYAPMTTNWIRLGSTSKLLKSQVNWLYITCFV